MAATVAWTVPALRDLEAAYEFIFRDSPRYARRLALDALELADTLASLPNRGRVVPEVNDPKVREVFLDQYRMIYEIRGDHVIILSIVHMSRDFTKFARGE